MNIIHYLFPLFISGTFAVPVKYDQRQDGEVNVRADLQNFVIVALIPKLDGASAGTALLNAITKTIPERRSDKLPIRRSEEFGDDLPSSRNEPFVEKKNTPYHVDITQGKVSDANKQHAKDSHQSGRKSNLAAHVSSKLRTAGSPLPDVLPVKDNKYVSNERKQGRRSIEFTNVIDESNSNNEATSDASEENEDDPPKPPLGVQYWLLGARENCGPDAYRDASLLCVPCPSGQVVDFDSGLCKDLQ